MFENITSFSKVTKRNNFEETFSIFFFLSIFCILLFSPLPVHLVSWNLTAFIHTAINLESMTAELNCAQDYFFLFLFIICFFTSIFPD